MIKIWTVGDIYYPDVKETNGLPVRFSEDDLKSIASSTDKIKLTENHDGKELGVLENFVYKDGALYVNKPNVDIEGLGISPVFDFALQEHDGYFSPNGLKLIEAGLVKNPRNHIYYNNSNGDDNMDDKAKLLESIQKNNDEIRSQREEIGTLKARNKKLEEELNKRKELEKQFNAKNKEFEDLQAKFETNKSKAEAYDKLENDKKQALVKELAGDDEEATKKFSEMSIENLEFIKDHKLLNKPPKGIPNTGETNDDGTTPNDDEEEEKDYEYYQKWAKENGVR